MISTFYNSIAQRLELFDTDNPRLKPIYVDFTDDQFTHFQKTRGLQEPLARAIGVKKDFYPTVLDATAGLGKDAFLLATLGCYVTLLERSTIIAKLLSDGLNRGKHFPQLAPMLARMELKTIDSFDYLKKLSTSQYPEVIYLDPMYPYLNKSALVKKEMRLLRETVGDDLDSDKLFRVAMDRVKKRVVVKRHRHASFISRVEPSYIIQAKIIRFDVYLTTCAYIAK